MERFWIVDQLAREPKVQISPSENGGFYLKPPLDPQVQFPFLALHTMSCIVRQNFPDPPNTKVGFGAYLSKPEVTTLRAMVFMHKGLNVMQDPLHKTIGIPGLNYFEAQGECDASLFNLIKDCGNDFVHNMKQEDEKFPSDPFIIFLRMWGEWQRSSYEGLNNLGEGQGNLHKRSNRFKGKVLNSGWIDEHKHHAAFLDGKYDDKPVKLCEWIKKEKETFGLEGRLRLFAKEQRYKVPEHPSKKAYKSHVAALRKLYAVRYKMRELKEQAGEIYTVGSNNKIEKATFFPEPDPRLLWNFDF
jgi:hypothetical protein